MRSILTALGANVDTHRSCGYEELSLLPAAALSAERKIILLVVDGLGYRYLRRHRPQGALASHLLGSMTSVFPSTTAAAITCFLTGLPPAQHGLTGWFVRFREAGLVGTPLPYTVKGGGRSLSEYGLGPRVLLTAPSIFANLPVPSHQVYPRYLLNTEFTRAHQGQSSLWGYDYMEHWLERVAELAGEPGPGFVYGYWPKLDSISHEYGCGSDEAKAHLRTLDKAFAQFTRQIAGTGATVLLTADHGFVDTTAATRFEIESFPPLANALTDSLCGEPRTAFCYLHAEAGEQFRQDAATLLGDHAVCLPSQVLLDANAFGFGPTHPELEHRVGDYAMMMRENGVLIQKGFPPLVGFHGGTTRDEMLVPLVCYRAH